MNREYVLLSVKYSKMNGYLVFWGHKTKDDEQRSFGGYTMDLDNCERYSKEDLEDGFYIYDGKMTFKELLQKDSDGTFAVKVEDLKKFGTKKTIIWR